MEDFCQIMRYLPASYKSTQDGEYIAYLSDSFEQNYQNEKYQFALLACHMLYMSFVYFSVWQIKNSRPDDFAKSLIGFSKDDEKELLAASNPFTFWKISEARIFRFLKLVGCENDAIGKFAKLVEKRNDIAHPNGIIHCTDKKTADLRLSEILSQVDTIQQCMTPVLHGCLSQFLIDSADAENREYPDPKDQIQEILIHPNYFSEKDIEACLGFDIQSLQEKENFAGISALFKEFEGAYKTDQS